MLKTVLLLCLLPIPFACTTHSAVQVRVEKKGVNGHRYTIFHPDHLSIQVVTTRPRVDGERYQLSVAAAYTDLQSDRPLDLLVCQGRVLQDSARLRYLDGVLTILGDSLTITAIGKGQTPSYVQQVRRLRGTLLLQELLVYKGKNQRAAGGSLFQRRALVEFLHHSFAVVEGETDNLTMGQFADDLLGLGAVNALYLDMGDWDEGWYKEGGEVQILGKQRTQTGRQSNWLVFGVGD